MAKKNVIGYIVTNADGHPLELDRYAPKEPLILVWGDHATVFPERRNARNAIRRTERYALNNIDEPGRVWFEHDIVPVIAEENNG